MIKTIDKPARLTDAEARKLPDSLQQPAWHVIVLGVFTLGLYLPYWAYKNWRDLKDAHPYGKAALSVVPLLNLYMFATLTDTIAGLSPDPQSFQRRRPMLAVSAVIVTYIGISALSHLQGGWFLLSLLSSVPFAVVQHWLNEYHASVESSDLMVRHAFTPKEMVVIIIGALALGLIAAGLMMGV